MANKSVLELAVETGRWDSGLKKAQQALNKFTDASGGLQNALNNDNEKMQRFVQMMGQTDSVAKTAKGQLNDYKSTIEQLTLQYNKMTEAQKKAIGQDYLQAIDSMKQKYQAVNAEIEEINNSLKNVAPSSGGGGLFGGDGIKGMLQVFGGNLMTKAAGYVAGLGSEIVTVMNQSAELAKSAEGIQLAFARLGNGSLLDGLREATHGTVSDLELMKAAVKFNDFKLPVEELGTMLAFAQQKAKDTGQSVDYMVDSIVTGLGRKSLMILDNLGLSATEVREKMKETGDMTKAVGEIIREQMSKAGDYVETAADRAKQANVDLENAMFDLGNAMRETFGYTGWSDMAAGIKTELVGAITFTIETINEAKLRFMELLQLMGLADKPQKPTPSAPAPNGTYWEETDAQGNLLRSGRWLNGKQVQTGLGDVTVFGNAPDPNKKKTTRGGGSTVIGPTAGSFERFLNKSSFGADKLKPEDVISAPSIWEQFGSDIAKDMKGTLNVFTDGMVQANDAMNNLSIEGFRESYDQVQTDIDNLNEKLKQQKMAYSLAGQAAQNFGAALQGIDDPAAKAAGTVMQAVASIALGFAMASSNANTAGTGWGWLAWLAAGTAAMATTISTVHSLTGYAEGGMIKGNSYSGDNIGGLVDGSQLVGLNAGEIVLNQAQARNVAAGLQNNGMSGMRLQTKVRGTELLVWLDNSLAQSGRGELVTWGQ